MNNKLWDIDDSYTPPKYVLSGGHRGYIDPNSNKYENNSDIDETIETKVDNLPNRLQDLFNDFALLQYGGYLDDLTWDEFREIEPRAKQTYRSDTYFHVKEAHNIDTQIGFEIGSMFNHLSNVDDDDVWKDIVWGILLGFVGENMGDVVAGKEMENIEEVLDVINRSFSRSGMAEQSEMSLDYYLRSHAPNSEIVRKCLNKNGITDVEYIVGLISKHEEEKDHNKTTETYVDNLIKNLIQERKLKLIDEIYQDIIEDCKLMKSSNTLNNISGIQAENCLYATYTSTDKIASGEVAAEAETNLSTDSANLATAVLKRLSNSNDEDTETVTRHNVVKKSNGLWEVTDYGTLLCYKLFEEHYNFKSSLLKENTEAIYRYSLTPDSLEDDDKKLIDGCINEIYSSERVDT